MHAINKIEFFKFRLFESAAFLVHYCLLGYVLICLMTFIA
jgi:hypothetical protein